MQLSCNYLFSFPSTDKVTSDSSHLFNMTTRSETSAFNSEVRLIIHHLYLLLSLSLSQWHHMFTFHSNICLSLVTNTLLVSGLWRFPTYWMKSNFNPQMISILPVFNHHVFICHMADPKMLRNRNLNLPRQSKTKLLCAMFMVGEIICLLLLFTGYPHPYTQPLPITIHVPWCQSPGF